jgi:hypothetical protein
VPSSRFHNSGSFTKSAIGRASDIFLMSDWFIPTALLANDSSAGSGLFNVKAISIFGCAIAIVLVIVALVIYYEVTRKSSDSDPVSRAFELNTESDSFVDLITTGELIPEGTQQAPFTVYAENLWGHEDMGTLFNQFSVYE